MHPAHQNSILPSSKAHASPCSSVSSRKSRPYIQPPKMIPFNNSIFFLPLSLSYTTKMFFPVLFISLPGGNGFLLLRQFCLNFYLRFPPPLAARCAAYTILCVLYYDIRIAHGSGTASKRARSVGWRAT